MIEATPATLSPVAMGLLSRATTGAVSQAADRTLAAEVGVNPARLQTQLVEVVLCSCMQSYPVKAVLAGLTYSSGMGVAILGKQCRQ